MIMYRFGKLAIAGLLAGGLMTSTSAMAADFGGDCCADLEERVAELEATTVRKGNRKVSLTVSGWVAQQVMYWDDGVEDDVYQTGIGTTIANNFQFSGQAKITTDWSAGFVLRVEAGGADNLLVSQDDDDAAAGINLQNAYWFLKSNTYGSLSVGQLNPHSDNAAILPDASGSLVAANWVLYDTHSFFTRRNGLRNGGNWGDIGHCNSQPTGGLGVAGDCGAGAVPGNYVRYDSPTIAGFKFVADWGEDDAWDVGVNYAGTIGQFKISAAANYYNTTDIVGLVQGGDVQYFQAGAYVQHIPTGLFLYGAYGAEQTDDVDPSVILSDNAESWYAKAGIRQKWNAFGHTVLYGEAGQRLDAIDYGVYGGATGSELTQWGLGVVQEIDAAAMSLFMNYRNIEGEVDCGAAGCVNADAVATGVAGTNTFDDFHVFKAGALIAF